MRRPTPNEYAEYQSQYIDLVADDAISFAGEQGEAFARMMTSMDESVGDVIHPPYGWTVKQVVSHINDAERVFGYRALRFSVQDPTNLPGFDEHHFVNNTDLSGVSLAGLCDEFQHLRAANLALLGRVSRDSLDNSGVADGREFSLRTMAFLIAGHAEHHIRILRRRLGLQDG